MMLDDRVRTLHRSRERFLEHRGALETLPGVRPDILASWRRSLEYGLQPERSRPTYAAPGDADLLVQATRGVVDSRRHHLSDASASLALTDHTGRLLIRYVEDSGFKRRLDHHDVLPGFSFAETTIGTNSGGMVLETGRPAIVVGPEHFFAESLQLTCVGAPVRHPLTKRILGTLDLTCTYDQTSPLLLAWVTELATEIERNLTAAMSTHEQALLAAYLTANHDAAQAVVCLDERTIVSNATASRMLAPQDQAVLWERAGRRVHSDVPQGSDRLVLTNGSTVEVSTEPVRDAGSTVGALVRLRRVAGPTGAGTTGAGTTGQRPAGGPAGPSTLAPLPDLVGRSEAWTAVRRRLAALSCAAVALVGERGTGKTAIAHAWLAGCGAAEPRTVDLTGLASADRTDCIAELRAAVGGAVPTVLLRHLDHVTTEQEPVLAGVLETAAANGVRIIGTCTRRAFASEPTVLDLFGATVDIPAVADRPDDIAPLLEELSWRITGGLRRNRWTSEAVQIVTRATWPTNVAGLEALVRTVVSGRAMDQVTAAHLPAAIRARAARRPLHGLERIEAQAIMEAFARANGNKKAAADALGIARSTFYRKVRALGVDLAGHTF